jgi:hypothetical protein
MKDIEYFEYGFKTGIGACLDLEDIPKEFSTYFLWYPDYLTPIERPLKQANEKHLKKIYEEIVATAGKDVASEVYNEEVHSLIRKYEELETFKERRRWLCGFWSGVIVGRFFEDKEWA